MDAPLLALTRRRGTEPTEAPATDNLRQLVQLRWLAVGGQLVTILSSPLGCGVPLPLAPMLGVVGLLALANLIGSVAAAAPSRHQCRDAASRCCSTWRADRAAVLERRRRATRSSRFYLLQVVLGAILLERWSVGAASAAASLCYAGLTRRYRAARAIRPGWCPRSRTCRRSARWIGFALTGTLLALFVTRITRNLRARDLRLADLRQHAAEEDGIVRMGLFASGAAHELGTPLRQPVGDAGRLAPHAARRADPELAGELAEMQAEVRAARRSSPTSSIPPAAARRGAGERRRRARSSTRWSPPGGRRHAGVPLDCTVRAVREAR